MDLIRDFWGAFMAAVGFVVWLVRLEGRGNRNAEEVGRLERRMEEDRKDSRDSRKEMMDAIRDMQKDIKRLLEKVGGGM